MKKGKIVLLALAFCTMCIVPECKAADTTATAKPEVITYTEQHPTAKDSLMLVTVINGIKNVVSIYNPAAGNVVDIVAPTAGIVAFICAIWRRIEKRRLRKKGILKDGK